MGYTTKFKGSFNLDKPLKKEHKDYLKKFAETRRMKRNGKIAETFSDPIREAAGLPIGIDGGYFVNGKGFAGQDNDESVINSNREPEGQPGLWCQWIPNNTGTEIIWDGGEKFYCYTEWLEYLIAHFLNPWGYILNGKIAWQGEEMEDSGVIYVKNNKIKKKLKVRKKS